MSERVERHYRNVDYHEAPDAAPAVFRAVDHASRVTRQAEAMISQADAMIAAIDDTLDDAKDHATPPPGPEHHHHDAEELPAPLGARKKLGMVAVLAAQHDELPPAAQAA